MKKAIKPILIFFALIACSSPDEQAQYKQLGSMQAFAEMVAGDVKPLALSEPMLSEDVDKLWEDAQTIAKYNGIEVFREPGLVDECRGMHRFTEQKGTSVSFIVKDLDSWYAYVKNHEPFPLVQELYTGKEERYNAFVGIDPGKYYLEFDRFLEHNDNSRIMEFLQRQ
jgi:hypothetical protein